MANPRRVDRFEQATNAHRSATEEPTEGATNGVSDGVKTPLNMETLMERTEQSVAGEQVEQTELNTKLRNGSLLMALAGIAFIGYGVVFLVLNFVGGGFELGVSTLDGLAPGDLDPTVAYYISHLHVATAAFIISTGIAVTALSWYGVRQRLRWAWATAVVAAVVGLAIALPMHYTGEFAHDWVTHLGPIYLAVIVFVVGVVLAYQGMRTPE